MGYIVTLLSRKKNMLISYFGRYLIFATYFTVTLVQCLYVAFFVVE